MISTFVLLVMSQVLETWVSDFESGVKNGFFKGKLNKKKFDFWYSNLYFVARTSPLVRIGIHSYEMNLRNLS